MAKLILLDGARGGDEVELGHSLVLGRAGESDLVLPDDGVSKHHARIDLRGERHVLTDLESLNGTYVNRRRVKERDLKHRDELRIGSTRILFIDPRQARQEAIGLSISLADAKESPESAPEAEPLATETTAVFRLPELDEPDELGRFMQEYEKLHMAFRVGGELTGLRDEAEIGSTVLTELFHIVPADRGVVFLTPATGGNLQQVFARDASGGAGPSHRIDPCRALVRAAAARRVGILVLDMGQDERFGGDQAGDARSALAVPLVRRGQLTGVLYLDNVHRPAAFSSEDMDLVLGVGIHVAAAVESLRLLEDVEGERRARERVSRYLSPNLVERVVQGESGIHLGGEKAEVTVLFADLRGFTSQAEAMAPDEVVVMLNEYFELAVDLIFKFGGTLDKFIGDAVMAFWGVPVHRSIDPHLTVLTALKMQSELSCLNERRRKLGKGRLGLGVGIHTGPAVAGNIGTPQRMDYTVIGDTVNLASRIQDLAPPGQVVISGATRDQMGNLLRVSPLGEGSVKGRRGRVELFRVHGMYLQEQVAHELRRIRRMTVCLPGKLEAPTEEDQVPGVVVDLSPAGAGLLFEEAARFRFEMGEPLRFELGPEAVPGAGEIVEGRVAAVREVFERSGTVYLHVGLALEDGPPLALREFLFSDQ